MARLFGVALLAVIFVGSISTLAAIAEANNQPNPFVGDSFVCCGHADTWSEVAIGSGRATGLAAATTAVGVIIAMLFGNYRLPWSTFSLYPAFAAGATLVLIAVGIVLDMGDGRTPPDCDTFTVDRRLFREQSESRAHQEMVLGVAACDVLTGRTPREVESLLGPPDGPLTRAYPELPAQMTYGLLTITFERGRVRSTKVVSPPSGYD